MPRHRLGVGRARPAIWPTTHTHFPCARLQVSPIARPTCHCRIPNLFPLHIKDEVGVSRRGVPVIACELTFELTSAPTCVAKGDQCFLWAGLAGDVAKHLSAWGNRGKLFYSDGIRAIVVSTVYHEAGSSLYGAPREDLHLTRGRRVALAQKAQKLRQRMFPERAIDCDAERAVLRVPDHKDDCAAKTGIANCWGCDQYLPDQRRIIRFELEFWGTGPDNGAAASSAPKNKKKRLKQAKGAHPCKGGWGHVTFREGERSCQHWATPNEPPG